MSHNGHAPSRLSPDPLCRASRTRHKKEEAPPFTCFGATDLSTRPRLTSWNEASHSLLMRSFRYERPGSFRGLVLVLPGDSRIAHRL